MSLKSTSKWVLPKEKINDGDIAGYVISKRGFDKEEFLNSSLGDIPSFEYMHDCKSAGRIIADAVKEGKKIVIHGDFDADGICAVSILWEFLYKEVSKKLGIDVDVLPYIPSRVDQGYGLTPSSLDDVIELGAQLVVSVDCGVRDRELVNRYRKEKGLEFVITDHHQPPVDLDDTLEYPLVHPMYPQHEYPFKNVCGAYVAFLLVQAIKHELKMDENISADTRGLDLVALATVTDLMPLVGVNRTVVKYGIEQIKKGERVGLNELIKVSGLNLGDIEGYHLGYILGPRINAAGRIGSPIDAVKLLVSDNSKVCVRIADILNETNFERQYITETGFNEAVDIIGESTEEKIIFVASKDWHEGIVGLIAGKLNEKYHRPTLVGKRNGNVVKGSARSIPGFNITEALSKCDQFLDRYGGHELAAGFTIKEGKEKEFSKSIKEVAESMITNDMLIKTLNIDLLLGSESINRGLIEELDKLKPFGYGNSKPLIALTDLIVFKKNIMGKLGNHMKLVCKGDGIDLITLVFFNCNEDTEEIKINDHIDVVGDIGINSWNGNEEVQFLVKEWKFSS